MRPTYRSSGRAFGTRSHLRVMAAKGQWFLQELECLIGLVSFLYTLLAFLVALCLLPVVIALYLVVNGARRLWFRLLEKSFPKLEFVKNITVRTAIDTRRNQGIITLLLQVKGRCDNELVKNRLDEHIVQRRNKDGSLSFPHLRTPLSTCWGCYAWAKPTSFQLENHLVEGSPLFRGRPITELNIQECVSDIVSKYLPPEHSPWQVTVIPSLSGPEERFFVLIRLHHLLMSEEGLGLGDLLLLRPENPSLWRRPLGEDDENPVQDDPVDRPFVGLFQTPVAMPKLCQCFREMFIEHWNRFILAYDPIENPDLMKSSPYLSTCLALMTITSIAVVRELIRSFKVTNESYFTTLMGVFSIIESQGKKRQCNVQLMARGIFNSLNPFQLFSTGVTWMWWISITTVIRVPITIFRELLLLCIKRTSTPGTYTEVLYKYWSLIFASLKELWYIWKVIYTGPRIVIEELLRSHQSQTHQLQTVSLCGRKVVAWSDAVSTSLVRKIRAATGATTSEVLMSATSRALREYFRQLGLLVPDVVLATARFLPLENLMKTTRGPSGRPACDAGGWLCLPLPTRTLLGDFSDPTEGLKALQRAIGRARARQTVLHLASRWPRDGALATTLLPEFVVRLLVNYLSRRYAVTITDVAPNSPDETRKRLLWGQEVESIIYWRPPQGNISLSLSLVSYGDAVRLGVMSDAQLSPQHAMLASGFVHQLHELAMAAGVTRDRVTPLASPGPSSQQRLLRATSVPH